MANIKLRNAQPHATYDVFQRCVGDLGTIATGSEARATRRSRIHHNQAVATTLTCAFPAKSTSTWARFRCLGESADRSREIEVSAEPGTNPAELVSSPVSRRPRPALRITGILTAGGHSHSRAWRCILKRPQTAKHPALVRTLIACAAMTDLAFRPERTVPW